MNNTYIILFLFVFLNNSIFSCTRTLYTHIYIQIYICTWKDGLGIYKDAVTSRF